MDKNKYSRTFLKEVIIRLDFAAPIDQISKVLRKELEEQISKAFPISEPRQYIGTDLIITKDSQKQINSQGTQWLFHSTETDKTLTVDKDNLNISYKKYDSFDNLKRDFIPIVALLFSIYDDVQGMRLGLRYINDIEPSEDENPDWSKFINSKLLSMLEFPDKFEEVSRAFNNLSFNYGNLLLTFHYGIYNTAFPAPIRKKTFILDYDAYHKGPQNLEDIQRNIDEFHNRIQHLFEQSITDSLRVMMGARKSG